VKTVYSSGYTRVVKKCVQGGYTRVGRERCTTVGIPGLVERGVPWWVRCASLRAIPVHCWVIQTVLVKHCFL